MLPDPSTATRDGRGIVQRVLRPPKPGERERERERGGKRDGGRRTAGGVRLPYIPGLDGLRALAVIAVLLYHAGPRWAPGGFLGVEVFFVISGYLITSLLLAEWRQRGRIDLAAFWVGRARRLLPALYVLLVVTLAFAVLFLPEEVAGLRLDALAAVGYVTNWYLVLGQESYFEAVGRPSLLQHLWSLAIEEQFYLLWPLLFAAGMSLGTRRWWRRRLLLAALAALVGAAASALLMTVLYGTGVEPSRLYYGTDTRATGLLVGAALAYVWAPFVWVPRRTPGAMDRPAAPRHGWVRYARWFGRMRRRFGWTFPLLLDAVGLASLGGLVWFCLRLDESQTFLYRGGFVSVALATVALIVVVVHPRARLGAGLLGLRPLRWIGKRSYGIYLWHWPVFTVTRPELDVAITGLPLLALRLAATIALAALSYRFFEEPIRAGALGRAWERLREARGFQRRRLAVRWAGILGTGVAFSVALGFALATAQPPALPSYLSVEAVHTGAPLTTPKTEDNEAATSRETAEVDFEAAPSTAPETAPAGMTAGRITAVGDSVMVGAAGELTRAIGDPEIDAEVGRQASTVIDILSQRRSTGQLGDVVVLHIGNNGAVTAEQFDELMQTLEGARKVVFVNVKVPRPWEQPNNDVLAEGVQRYPNAVLIDWYAASAGRPEFFWEDGYHIRPEGQPIYADLIAARLEAS